MRKSRPRDVVRALTPWMAARRGKNRGFECQEGVYLGFGSWHEFHGWLTVS